LQIIEAHFNLCNSLYETDEDLNKAKKEAIEFIKEYQDQFQKSVLLLHTFLNIVYP
jgi:hypothetical protein